MRYLLAYLIALDGIFELLALLFIAFMIAMGNPLALYLFYVGSVAALAGPIALSLKKEKK